MRKYCIFILFILFITGCSAPGGSDQSPENRAAGWRADEPRKVTVSRVVGYGHSDSRLGTFEDNKSLGVFMNALQSGRRIEGILDVRAPDYRLDMIVGNRQDSYLLWLSRGEGGTGMYMNASNSETGYTLTPEGSAQLQSLLGKLKYTSEIAERNGDVAGLPGRFKNLEKWYKFIEQTDQKSGQQAEIQLTQYTIEGEPIFSNLWYDGKLIHFVFDATWNTYGSTIKATAACKRIKPADTPEGTLYTLSGCDHKEGELFHLLIPKASR